ncbi:hypothetical protein BCT49_17260 [Vibrio lentus]|uniref:Uncharacterized protein n=1 Tax=Vibrio lentus TaxID=136468 RepID=A0A2N7JVU1_9VIBR|nr:hypothetical protein BCT49_17260 [Vibrio lentus]
MHFWTLWGPFDSYFEYWSLINRKKFQYIYVIYFSKNGMIYKCLVKTLHDYDFYHINRLLHTKAQRMTLVKIR